MQLTFVKSPEEIKISLDNFNKEYQQDIDLANSLLEKTKLWVYDRTSHNFGPNKFVGYKNMTMKGYAQARLGIYNGATFHGNFTHKKISKLLGEYHPDLELAQKLIKWGENLIGKNLFDSVDQRKWKFVTLE